MKNLEYSQEDNQLLDEMYCKSEPEFYTFDLEDGNVKDAKEWLDKGVMEAIVSEEHGGIIGYVHQEYAQAVAEILNLHVLKNK